jgi:hypothetical protein
MKEIHLGRTDEPSNKNVPRSAVKFHRGADLLDDAAVHNDDPVGECHRLHAFSLSRAQTYLQGFFRWTACPAGVARNRRGFGPFATSLRQVT